MVTGKGLFTIVGGYHADPKDPKSPGKDAKWDEDGSVEEFKRLYQVSEPTRVPSTMPTPRSIGTQPFGHS
jgi:salicylate hydroxylase